MKPWNENVNEFDNSETSHEDTWLLWSKMMIDIVTSNNVLQCYYRNDSNGTGGNHNTDIDST